LYCPKCGKPLNGAAFCTECGATAEQPLRDGEKVTPNITLGDDGKYRWIYEMSLLKNPTIFLLVWKIFFFIFIGIFAVVMLIDLCSGNMDTGRLLDSLKMIGYSLLGMTALVAIGVLIYSAKMGGKYIVMFEMDEEGINHKQVPTQAKKARSIGRFTAAAGAAKGSLSATAVGINAQNTEMYTEFARVRKVKSYPGRNLIKVNERLNHNQVYAADEDFAFVENFIMDHVPEQAKQ